jgi:hypothetical protein
MNSTLLTACNTQLPITIQFGNAKYNKIQVVEEHDESNLSRVA